MPKSLDEFFADTENIFGKGDTTLDENTGEFDLNLDNEPESLEEEEAVEGDDLEDAVAEDDGSSDGDEEESEPGTPDLSPALTRIQNLETSIDTVVRTLELVVQKIAGQPQQPASTESDDGDDFDFSDTTSFKKQIGAMIKEAISNEIKPFQDMNREMQLRHQYNTAVQKYGEDFQSSLPAIGEILKVNPELGFEKAYEVVKQVRGIKPAATQDGNTKTPNQKVVSNNLKQPITQKKVVKKPAQALVQREQALKTESGVGVQKDKQRASRNLDEAIESAFKSLRDSRSNAA